jgi:hypothetical protein
MLVANSHLLKDCSGYQQLITEILVQVSVPNLSYFNINMPDFNICMLAHKSGLRIDTAKLLEKINGMTANEQNSRNLLLINYIKAMLTLLSGDHQQAKINFILSTGWLKSSDCFQSMQEVDLYAQFVRLLFDNLEEILNLFDRHIYSNDFFSKNILSQKAAIFWIVEIMWNAVYKEETAYLNLYPKFLYIFRKAIETDNSELAFFMHFPLSHIYLNRTQSMEQWKQFNEDVEKPLAEYSAKIASKLNLPPVRKFEKKPKYKIAFTLDRVIQNSLFKVAYSLLADIHDADYVEKIYFYDLEYIDKSVSDPQAVQMLKDLRIEYVSIHELLDPEKHSHYYSHFEKSMLLRERLIQDDIDIYVFTNNREMYTFSATVRSAPKQILWSHGNLTYNIPNTDSKFTHCHTEDVIKRYDYQRLFINFKEDFLNQKIEQSKILAERKKYPAHHTIVGNMGRLVKTESEEYLEVLARAIRQYPDTTFLACGTGGKEIIQRLVKEKGISKNFRMPGFVDAHLYGNIIDIFLDTFPHRNGMSANEFSEKKPAWILSVKHYEYSRDFIEHDPDIEGLTNEQKRILTELLAALEVKKADFMPNFPEDKAVFAYFEPFACITDRELSMLIKAFSKLVNANLYMLGTGNMEYMKDRLGKLGAPDNIIVTKMGDPMKYIDKIDVLVAPRVPYQTEFVYRYCQKLISLPAIFLDQFENTPLPFSDNIETPDYIKEIFLDAMNISEEEFYAKSLPERGKFFFAIFFDNVDEIMNSYDSDDPQDRIDMEIQKLANKEYYKLVRRLANWDDDLNYLTPKFEEAKGEMAKAFKEILDQQ